MAYTNTVDSKGDAALCTAILNRTLDEIVDTYCAIVGGYAFYKCTALHTAKFENATSIEQYAFANCSALKTIDFPLSTTAGYYSFYKCSSLQRADFPRVTSLGRYAFHSCSTLETLILRSETMATMSDTNALENTPIESGTGYVYVPAALVDSYKAAENWSTYANQIRAIEDYPAEVTDPYTWEGVAMNIANGSYASVYNIGDTVPLDLGSEGLVNMQIAAFDADDLADGSGKAHISWISKELLKTSKRWNPSLVTNGDGTYQEGTGTIGGWEKSELREYYNDTLLPLIPEEVRSRIVPVTKTQTAYDTAGLSFTQTTDETVWPPSYPEMFGSSSLYYGLFKGTAANLIKYRVGASSATYWWLRSANYITSADRVNTYGGSSNDVVNNAYALALGFCT